MEDILYRCPNECGSGFKVESTLYAVEYMDESGEVTDTRILGSDFLSPVVCLACDANAKEVNSGEDH